MKHRVAFPFDWVGPVVFHPTQLLILLFLLPANFAHAQFGAMGGMGGGFGFDGGISVQDQNAVLSPASPTDPISPRTRLAGIAIGEPPAATAMELRLRSHFRFDDRCGTLAKLAAELNRHGIPTFIDIIELEDLAIEPSTSLATSPPRTQRIKDGLRRLLKPLGLAYRSNDDRITIGSDEGHEPLRLYDVTALCPDNDIDSLIDSVTSHVAPDSWEDVGGPATISPILRRGRWLFAVSQTEENHEQVAGLLLAIDKLTHSGNAPPRSRLKRSNLRRSRPQPVRHPTPPPAPPMPAPLPGGFF